MEFWTVTTPATVSTIAEPPGFLASHFARGNAVITGAGISHEYPAVLPIAEAGYLSLGLRNRLLDLLTQASSPGVLLLLPSIQGLLQTLPVEVLLSFVVRVIGYDFLDFYKVLTAETVQPSPEPTFTHHFIAALAEAKAVTSVLTFNFDNLHERALYQRGVPFFCPEHAEIEEAEAEVYERAAHHRDLCLFKLHGTFPPPRWSRFLATLQEVGSGLPPHKEKLVLRICETLNLTFMGYSDNDIDTFPLLLRSSRSSTILWYEKFSSVLNGPRFNSVREYLSPRDHLIVTGELSDVLAHIGATVSFPVQMPTLMETSGVGTTAELISHSQNLALSRDADISTFFQHL